MSVRHLVTGAAGLIGFELTRQLLEIGDEVVVVDDGRKGGVRDLDLLARENRGRLHVVHGDLARGIPAEVAGTTFETIAHLAAIVGVQIVSDQPYRTIESNLRSTLNVFDFAIAHPPRTVLFASSSENYAFGVQRGWLAIPTGEDVPLGIDDPKLPRWSYAASKIAGESALFSAARLAPFAPIVARIHNVYGPRMGPTHVVPEMLARCHARVDPFPVAGADQTRSFMYVEDAARALILLIEAGARRERGVWNVGSSVETRIDDLARLCLLISEHDAALEPRPAPPGSVARRVPDVRKLAKLGFVPRVALEDGVRACWQASLGEVPPAPR
jgi:UDP-glucuronate decarboxylase